MVGRQLIRRMTTALVGIWVGRHETAVGDDSRCKVGETWRRGGRVTCRRGRRTLKWKSRDSMRKRGVGAGGRQRERVNCGRRTMERGHRTVGGTSQALPLRAAEKPPDGTANPPVSTTTVGTACQVECALALACPTRGVACSLVGLLVRFVGFLGVCVFSLAHCVLPCSFSWFVREYKEKSCQGRSASDWCYFACAKRQFAQTSSRAFDKLPAQFVIARLRRQPVHACRASAPIAGDPFECKSQVAPVGVAPRFRVGRWGGGLAERPEPRAGLLDAR
jgi:hypothetical protein